jgi:hypothetical protein
MKVRENKFMFSCKYYTAKLNLLTFNFLVGTPSIPNSNFLCMFTKSLLNQGYFTYKFYQGKLLKWRQNIYHLLVYYGNLAET